MWRTGWRWTEGQGSQESTPPPQDSRCQPSLLTSQIPGAQGPESEGCQLLPPCSTVMPMHHTPAPAHIPQSPRERSGRGRVRGRGSGVSCGPVQPKGGESMSCPAGLPREAPPSKEHPAISRLDGQALVRSLEWEMVGGEQGREGVVVVVVVVRDAGQAGP